MKKYKPKKINIKKLELFLSKIEKKDCKTENKIEKKDGIKF
jgi:hypothetical protein